LGNFDIIAYLRIKEALKNWDYFIED
jgi:hypothetical protein